MALFPPRSNALLRATLAALFVLVVALIGFGAGAPRPSTLAGTVIQQPIAFDHRNHVGELGFDCRYCHSDVELARRAGTPSLVVCFDCHAQVLVDAPSLAPLRAAYYEGAPLAWRRVHRLADGVFFDHAAHSRRGIPCIDCHGDVATMASVTQVASLSMGSCVDCHRRAGASTDCTECHR